MNSYKVTMRMGQDTCNTVTIVEARDADEAAAVADLKWTDITVRVLDVERTDDGNGYGYCDIHKDQALEDHCTSCTSVYCEACEYE